MIYLIDFENVHSDGLKGIEQLGKKDKCYIFYSEHAGVLTFNMHKRITESKADIFYVEAQVGMKNALDFQLVSYLGYMIREALRKIIALFQTIRLSSLWEGSGRIRT